MTTMNRTAMIAVGIVLALLLIGICSYFTMFNTGGTPYPTNPAPGTTPTLSPGAWIMLFPPV